MKKTTSTTKKRRKRTERSPRQQWHSERNWEAVGQLESARMLSLRIAEFDSTLSIEKFELHAVASYLAKVINRIKNESSKEESYKLFCKRKGFVK